MRRRQPPQLVGREPTVRPATVRNPRQAASQAPLEGRCPERTGPDRPGGIKLMKHRDQAGDGRRWKIGDGRWVVPGLQGSDQPKRAAPLLITITDVMEEQRDYGTGGLSEQLRESRSGPCRDLED